mmetsp:Transcript_35337/g.88150  ORF Transcript_35337/g.88150 Transcript_35337/m.88150 type:complete len:202 (+) Transcript_35337:1020-1625(+)
MPARVGRELDELTGVAHRQHVSRVELDHGETPRAQLEDRKELAQVGRPLGAAFERKLSRHGGWQRQDHRRLRCCADCARARALGSREPVVEEVEREPDDGRARGDPCERAHEDLVPVQVRATERADQADLVRPASHRLAAAGRQKERLRESGGGSGRQKHTLCGTRGPRRSFVRAGHDRLRQQSPRRQRHKSRARVRPPVP